MDIKLTIGALKTRNVRNGNALVDITSNEDLEKVRRVAIGKEKADLPALTTYRGVRGEYTPSNIFFVDIDTTEGVDKILADPNKLFTYLPNIYFIQKSYSGKLHICGIFNRELDTAEEWSDMTRIYTAATIHIINKIYGIDYTKVEKGIDTHSFGYYQLLYVSAEDIVFNEELTPISFGEKDIKKLFDTYPLFKPAKREITVNRDGGELQGKYEAGYNNGRVCIDRNLKIGNLRGNDIRWRISKIAVEIFGKEAKEWCDKHFYYGRGTSIFSNTRKDIGINHLVLKWLTRNGYLQIKEEEPAPVQTNPNYACIDMDEMMNESEALFVKGSSKFLSSYVNVIDSYIQNENVLAIIAPTGAGKTSCLSGMINGRKATDGLVDLYPNSYIIVPMNVTNELYKGLNIVSSSNNNSIKPGKPNVMIWDRFVKEFPQIVKHRPDVVFVDESHTAFFDREYRDSPILFLESNLRMLQEMGTKIVFISATPAGEISMFNAFVLEFKRKDTRHVKFQLCYTEDTHSSMVDDIRTGGFDKICIFSDQDCKLVYADCIKMKKDAMIYHSCWPKNVDQLRRDERIISPVSLFTCLAFNGLNIRNTGEKILIDIRYTQGDTTYNEILQIVGRLRFNDDITVRIYVDGKNERSTTLQEEFSNAKAIIDSESDEVITPYWERLNDKDVQNALTSIEIFKKKFTLPNIVTFIKNDGYEIKAYKVSGVEKLQRRNPLKKEASDLYKALRMKEIDEIDRENVDKEVLKFIDEWDHEINAMKYAYNDKVLEVLDSMISKDGKTTPILMSTIIDRLKNILKIWHMSDSDWCDAVAKRALLLSDKNLQVNLRKQLIKVFAENDLLREKYKDMDFRAAAESIIVEQDEMLSSFFDSQVEKGKKGKKVIYNDEVYDSCEALASVLNKKPNTITNWIKKGKVLIINELN